MPFRGNLSIFVNFRFMTIMVVTQLSLTPEGVPEPGKTWCQTLWEVGAALVASCHSAFLESFVNKQGDH